jgi:hypothetical protein
MEDDLDLEHSFTTEEVIEKIKQKGYRPPSKRTLNVILRSLDNICQRKKRWYITTTEEFRALPKPAYKAKPDDAAHINCHVNGLTVAAPNGWRRLKVGERIPKGARYYFKSEYDKRGSWTRNTLWVRHIYTETMKIIRPIIVPREFRHDN